MKPHHDDAEAQLDRELGDSYHLPTPHTHRHRVTYSLPAVLICSVLGGVAAYAISSFVIKAGLSTVWAYTLSGLAIALLAWGISGLPRGPATVTERLIDVAVSLVVASVVYGLVSPMPLGELFVPVMRPDGSLATSGLGGMPRFHIALAWSAILA